jgi:twitching motility two-component system response regulator PilG
MPTMAPSPFYRAEQDTMDSDLPLYPGTGDRTIMLIDDSLAVRRIIEASFARIGIMTTTFPDGILAIQALAKREVAVPDLLLLDIGLPKMNGYEVAHILRGNPAFADMILVMLSGHDGMIDRVHSRLVGAKDFIRKPFRVSEVIRIVCTLLQIPLSQ